MNLKKYLYKSFVFLYIILFLYLLCSKNYEGMLNHSDSIVYITMTTTPDRLSYDWFYDNLKNTLNLNGNYNVMLNIPKIYNNTEVPYILPKQMNDLNDKYKNLHIFRPEKDYGPITKLYGSLINDDITDDTPLLVCDDDMHYLPKFVVTIYDKYLKDTSKIYTYCNNTIQGYKGFLVKKQLIKPMIKYEIPDSCFRIDDDFITKIANFLKLEVVSVPYDEDKNVYCSMNRDKTDTHPKWNELIKDNRAPLQKKCEKDFIESIVNK